MCATPPSTLPEAALPDTLRHEPSRRFLTGTGLPPQAAELEFTSVREGRLRPLTEDVDDAGGPVVLDGRLLVLGRTGQPGARLVLDGVEGGVHLVARDADDPGSLAFDRIATGLPELARLIGQIEAVSGAPRDPAPPDRPRGLAALARTREETETGLRRADPHLYEVYDNAAGNGARRQPAHWGTALFVRTLHLAARPGDGTPGALAYELDPAMVTDLAEGGRVRRFTEDELPPALTHEPTRHLLTRAGLPRDTLMFTMGDGPLRTLADAALSFRPHQRDHLALGWWAEDAALALDGTTGRIEIPDWYGDDSVAPYLHQDLSALVLACWTLQQFRKAYQRADAEEDHWYVHAPHHLLASRVVPAVTAVDPASWATDLHIWPLLEADEQVGGML
ncbi:hypothetical protein FM076_13570 [Streptomyces albus subsp. chlorinus]|uniref:SUKH-4 family immunity protein n=1 Tax=Streptomyces albus TaxID=1888 RepID=UPI001570761F|nr:SUKH-4 family immunity protein [Streptomyces albus]NSC22163.1 hypothetical protein [Streptomyces albus subsp. chlorinus]